MVAGHTLYADVHDVRAVCGARRRLWGILQLGEIDAPLRAGRDVHLTLSNDGENDLRSCRKVSVRRRLGY